MLAEKIAEKLFNSVATRFEGRFGILHKNILNWSDLFLKCFFCKKFHTSAQHLAWQHFTFDDQFRCQPWSMLLVPATLEWGKPYVTVFAVVNGVSKSAYLAKCYSPSMLLLIKLFTMHDLEITQLAYWHIVAYPQRNAGSMRHLLHAYTSRVQVVS